jgi:hypothetical protein
MVVYALLCWLCTREVKTQNNFNFGPASKVILATMENMAVMKNMNFPTFAPN